MATVEAVLRGLENDNFDSYNTWARSYSIDSFCNNGTRTLLSNAVRNSNTRAVFNLILKGANVNQREKMGATPLLLAIHLNHFKIVQRLIRSKADIKMGDSYDSPLTAAVRGGNLDIIEFLIDNGADISVCDMRGLSPIFQTIKDKKLPILALFVRKGVGKDVVDEDKNTPLVAAIKEGLIDVIQCLLEHGANVNETKNEKLPLAWAAEIENLEIVKILLTKGAKINMLSLDGNTALATAVRFKQSEIVKYLIEKNAKICKVGENGKTPLLWAVLNENLDTIKKLLDSGAEYIMDSVFLDAIGTKNLEVVKLLKERGAVDDAEDTAALKKSIDVESVEIAKYLIDSGANVVEDLEEKEISTAIKLFEENKIEMFKLLVQNGARLDEFEDCGEILLTKAILEEDFDIIKYLLVQGATINQPNRDGLTPLETAESKKDFEIFQFLVDCGATIGSVEETEDSTLLKCYKMARDNSFRRGKLNEEMSSSQEAAEN